MTHPKKDQGRIEKFLEVVFGNKSGSFLGFLGGLMLIVSTRSVNGPGTDGYGNLVFGRAKYYFVVDINPTLSKLGLYLVVIGFWMQFVSDWPLERRMVLVLLFIMPLVIFVTQIHS